MTLDDKAMRRKIAMVLAALSAGCAVPAPTPETQPACTCPVCDVYIQGSVSIYGSDAPDIVFVQQPVYGADIVSGGVVHMPLYAIGF